MFRNRTPGRWTGVVRPAFRLLAVAGLIVHILSTAGSVLPAPSAQAAACTSPANCLSMMTLAEKIGQMTQANKNALTATSDIATFALGSILSGGGEGPNGAGGTATQWADMYDSLQNAALQSRLRIPIIYGVDAVHGHNNVQGAVIFPHHIGMGATRDTALMEQADAVTRDEVLGTGMNWAFAPCVCVPQNDRWGRTYEGFGEDTALVSAMGAASVRGFQGAGLSTTTVMATAKHYVGDGGTTNGVDQGNTQITEAELRAIHLPPYQSAIANNVGSVMVSFSSWNGVKMHGNQFLITSVLKGELGFRGIVVTDWAGVDQINPDYATSVRTAINAGIDMVMVPSDYRRFISTLTAEVSAGRVPVSRIDDAVTRILTQKFALGLFTKRFTDRGFTAQVGSAAHRAVARQAVRESLVLLKNNGVLPLSKTATYKIVVGGSHVDNLGLQMGGWSISWQGASGATTTGTTFWQALQAAKPPNVTLQNVGTNTGGSYSGDVGIAVIGESPYAEGRGDSSTLAISAANATQVSDICSRTTRCVVILISGRPLIANTQLNQAAAFVAAWLPGTEGAGITDVLFGDSNFVGKLPVTWPNAVSQEPINNGDGKSGLFAFGFGLSYGTGPTPTPTVTPTPTRTPTPGSPTATPTRTPTPVPSANLALNRPATSSSNENASLTPNLAVDGNTGTRWSSAFSDPQWIRVDLGSTRTINRVVLRWEAAFGRSYQIQTSDDGNTWTTIFSTTTGDGGVDDLTVSGSGRFIRMNGTARGTQWGYSLWEFEVYGS
jgi:beta-glucosidase